MKKIFKMLAALLAAGLVFASLGCDSDTDTETEYVDKTYASAVTFTASSTDSGVSVAMATATNGAAIYYTTAGTAPTIESTLYTGAVEVTADTTFMAIAVKDGIENSPVSYAKVSIATKTITETKTVTETKNVTADSFLSATTADATTVRHYVNTNTSGRTFEWELKETEYKEVAAGTSLSDLAKDYEHFHAVGLKHDEANPQVVFVYYTYDLIIVAFDYDGGTSETTGDATTYSFTDYYSRTFTAPKIPSKEGYHFDYWTVDDEETEVSTTFSEDVTYKAHWHEIVNYTVTYTSGLGTASGSFEWPCHTRLTKKLDDVEESGTTYYFKGWYSDSGFTKRLTYTVLAENVTAYAKWSTEAVPEGFVAVAGVTFDGTSTLTPSSFVFISGRSIEIADLYVCDHEVTQGEYETYCKYGSDEPDSTCGDGDNYPAYYVNWYDAIVYCNLRSMIEELTPVYSISNETDPSKWTDIVSKTSGGITKYCGPTSSNSTWDNVSFDTTADGYRLPTEAEWEYIARGGSEWKTYYYSGSDTVGDVAWYQENSDYMTHEVKTKTANSLEIYDMSGNVLEFCYDWFSSSISTDTPATGAASGFCRVYRGGSWGNDNNCAMVYDRIYNTPNNRVDNLGFRVVRNAK